MKNEKLLPFILGNIAIVYSVVHHHKTFRNLTNLRIRSKKDQQNQEGEEENEESNTNWIPTNEWVRKSFHFYSFSFSKLAYCSYKNGNLNYL